MWNSLGGGGMEAGVWGAGREVLIRLEIRQFRVNHANTKCTFSQR